MAPNMDKSKGKGGSQKEAPKAAAGAAKPVDKPADKPVQGKAGKPHGK